MDPSPLQMESTHWMRITLSAAICAITCLLMNPASAQSARDGRGWPRTVTTPKGDRVAFSQPQVDDWNDGTIHAKIATEIQLAKQDKPCHGTINIYAHTTIDRDDRVVTLQEILIPALRFPVEANAIDPLRSAATWALQSARLEIGFDDLVVSMREQAFPAGDAIKLCDVPPKIIFRDSLAASPPDISDQFSEVVATDGPPKFATIVPNQLEGIENSQSLLFRDAEGIFFLLVSGRWLSADSLDSASWTSWTSWTFVQPALLPAAFAAIAESSRWAEALASVPNTPASRIAVLANSLASERTLPRNATMAVRWQGDPNFIEVDDSGLSCATNTDSVVLKIAASYYCLSGGAWFGATAPLGPWNLCATLPESIASIAIESPLFFVRFVTISGTTAQTITYRSTSGSRCAFMANGLVVYGTGYPVAVEFAKIESLPTPTYGSAMWWNPWTLDWCKGFGGVNSASQPAQPPSLKPDSPSLKPDSPSLKPDLSRENNFIGLDGRVYAHRDGKWWRNQSSGEWIEWTEKRSTLRVLATDLAARQAAIATATTFENWKRKQAAIQSGSHNAFNRCAVMDSLRPSTAHYQLSAGATHTEPSVPEKAGAP